MSAGDYMEALRAKNPKIFKAQEIKISVVSFEAQLRAAFAAGERAGAESRSLFESLFGPTLKSK